MATRRLPPCLSRLMRLSGTGASSAVTRFCWKLLVEDLPGARRWFDTRDRPGHARTALTKKNAALHGSAAFRPAAIFASYFEIERLNMRSIFSLVASTADWLA